MNDNCLLKCASYIRYSSSKQSDGLSVEYQSAANKKTIEKIGGIFIGEYIDRATSGFYKNISKREGMQNLLQIIRDGKANCVVFNDESRLTRGILDVYRELIVPIFQTNPNTKFYRSNDSKEWDLEDVNNKRNLIDACKESEKKRAYAKQGQENMIHANRRPGSRLPLGIKAITEDSIVADDNIAIVLFIFELASWGHSEQSIADILSSMKIMPLMSDSHRELYMASKNWSHTTIHYILNNPIYIGKGVWYRRKSRTNSSPGPEDQLQFFADFPPVIPLELWNLVQAEFDRKRMFTTDNVNIEKKNKLRMNTQFKLSGIVQCARCRIKLLAKNSLKKGTQNLYTRKGEPLLYYYCPKCDTRIESTNLDKIVIQQVQKALQNGINADTISEKLQKWLSVLEKKINTKINELEAEKYSFSINPPFIKSLTNNEFDAYRELCKINMEHLKAEIKELEYYRDASKNMLSSGSIEVIASRIVNTNLEVLNIFELRHILFSSIKSITVKKGTKNEPIINEIELHGIPIPYHKLAENI